MSVCVSVCVSASRSLAPTLCLSVCLSVCLCVKLCLSVRLCARRASRSSVLTLCPSVCVSQDSQQVVEVFKTGFEPPGDVEFEDHSAPMRRSISESSYLDNRAEQRHTRRNSRGRLWPFIRKNKVEAGETSSDDGWILDGS